MTKQPTGQATTPRPAKAKAVTYRAAGPRCGGCPHHHRTITGAQRCADRHQARVVRKRGVEVYSDRDVVRWDGRDLEAWERDAVTSAFIRGGVR
jgi:hypothetical protein